MRPVRDGGRIPVGCARFPPVPTRWVLVQRSPVQAGLAPGPLDPPYAEATRGAPTEKELAEHVEGMDRVGVLKTKARKVLERRDG